MAIVRRRAETVLAVLLVTAMMSTTALAADGSTTFSPPADGSETGGSPTLIQQNGDGYSAITIYDGVTEVQGPQYTGETQNSLQGTAEPGHPTRYYPFEITNVDEYGTLLVVKSFEVPAEVDPEALVEYNVERMGLIYEARDIMQKKTPNNTDSREASKKVTITSDTKDKSKNMEKLDETTFYSEGGYEGYLELDSESITTEVSGTSNYSYPMTEKKEFTGLARNDPSLIEKSITKNGVTLNLADVNWVSMGSTVNGDSIESTYKAVATYSGTAYGSKADGYIVTASYKGQAIKEVAGDYIYSIIYAPARDQEAAKNRLMGTTMDGQGTPPNEPNSSSITLGTKEDGQSVGAFFHNLVSNPMTKIILISAGAAIAVLLLILLVLRLRKNRKREPVQMDEQVYQEQPVVDDDPQVDIGYAEPEMEPEEGVTVGDSLRVYVPGSNGVLNISADDDPELSAIFEEREAGQAQEETPQPMDDEPPMEYMPQ